MQTKRAVPVLTAGLILGATVAAHDLPAPDRSKDLKPDAKVLKHSAVIEAPPAAVWASLTTGKGLKEFLGVESKVELRLGGPYEWYFAPDAPEFAGKRGGEGNAILSYLPERMLTFTWNAPPSFPKLRDERTWVVVELKPVADGHTEVTLTHLGWGTGGRWDEVHEYFDVAWGKVLGALRAHHAK